MTSFSRSVKGWRTRIVEAVRFVMVRCVPVISIQCQGIPPLRIRSRDNCHELGAIRHRTQRRVLLSLPSPTLWGQFFGKSLDKALSCCFIINDATIPRTPHLHPFPHRVVLFPPSPPGAQEPRPSDLRLPLLGLERPLRLRRTAPHFHRPRPTRGQEV